MAVPDFETLLLPVLKAIDSRNEISLSEVRAIVASNLGVTRKDLNETMESGQQTFNNRVNWAANYFEIAGVVARVRRGVYRMNNEGKQLLKKGLTRIDYEILRQYPGYVNWEKRGRQKTLTPTVKNR